MAADNKATFWIKRCCQENLFITSTPNRRPLENRHPLLLSPGFREKDLPPQFFWKLPLRLKLHFFFVSTRIFRDLGVVKKIICWVLAPNEFRGQFHESKVKRNSTWRNFTPNFNRLVSISFWLNVRLLSSVEETITLKLSRIYSQEEKKGESFN